MLLVYDDQYSYDGLITSKTKIKPSSLISLTISNNKKKSLQKQSSLTLNIHTSTGGGAGSAGGTSTFNTINNSTVSNTNTTVASKSNNLNLLSTSTVTSNSSNVNQSAYLESELYIESMILIDFLKSKENVPFWDREDISHSNPHTSSADQLGSLVTQTITILTEKYRDLRENWGSEALSWAISCPDYHWRCRSFQIYRSLNPIATPEILHDMLNALSKWLPSEDNGCGIELEILYCLQIIASSANTNRLVFI